MKTLTLSKWAQAILSTSRMKLHGQKFKSKFIGPFVIKEIKSLHLVLLLNPDTNISLKTPVYIDR